MAKPPGFSSAAREAQHAHAQNEDGCEGEEEHDHDVEQRREPVAQRGFGAPERGGAVKERAAPLRFSARDIAARAPRDEQRVQEKEEAEEFEETETHGSERIARGD